MTLDNLTLTDQQIEIVMHLCNGLTMEEVAVEMNYSIGSISRVLKTAKKNAGAKTTTHLIAMVILSGKLYYSPAGEDKAVAPMGDVLQASHPPERLSA